MNRAERKQWLRQVLLRRDLEQLASWGETRRDAERLLNSLAFDSDELVRSRAIEGLGLLARQRARTRPDAVRELVRRMLWAMNDESGNSIGHAPELAGELLASVPALVPEFASTLASLRECDPYQRGVRWAMARIAAAVPEAFAGEGETLRVSLQDPDPYIRGMALLALGCRNLPALLPLIEKLRDDPSKLEYYDFRSGGSTRASVGELAESALRRCSNGQSPPA